MLGWEEFLIRRSAFSCIPGFDCVRWRSCRTTRVRLDGRSEVVIYGIVRDCLKEVEERPDIQEVSRRIDAWCQQE